MMKVKVLVSFFGTAGAHSQGDIIELPDGVDWLRAGLVEALPEPEAEPAPTPEPEAPKPARKKKA